MSVVPAEVTDQIAVFRGFRDQIRLELNHRRMSGRRRHRDCLDVDDAQLESELAWYVEKIESLLAPFDNDD